MFQGNQNFKKACLFANWEDDLKVKSAVHDAMSSSTAPITFQSFVSNDTSFQAFPDTSDEEDAGLKRTQRQALKRELPWKSISESDRQAFVDAMAKEWAEWCKWSSCQKFEGDASKVSKEPDFAIAGVLSLETDRWRIFFQSKSQNCDSRFS